MGFIYCYDFTLQLNDHLLAFLRIDSTQDRGVFSFGICGNLVVLWNLILAFTSFLF